MLIDPANLDPRDRYKLLAGAVVPRPIAFVSTCDHQGNANLAPYSFFNAVGSDPMTLLFCPANAEDGSDKDTLRNCKPESEGGLGEFVVNVASESYIREVSAAAERLPFGKSEFALTGLASVPSVAVRPPRVADSPISFECRTLEVIRTNPGAPNSGNVVLGEVVRIHAAPGLVNDRYHVDADALAAVGRLSGAGYCLTRERFELPRGRAALDVTPPTPRTDRG